MADNYFRIGNVSEIYPDEGMISVTYPQFDNATTGKIPFFAHMDEYKMPQIGDHVLVIHFACGPAEGIALGGYWNQKVKCPMPGASSWWKGMAPSNTPDKAYMHYDDSTGTLTIHAAKIVLDATNIELVDELTTNSGLYTTDQDVVAQGKSLVNHTHTGAHGETSSAN